MPSSGAEFLPPLNSSFINRDTTTTLDGRGILIERIKVAQHTIDSLSAKVFFFENERILLKEKKEQFEAGYYKLVEENSKLLNEKIYKDTLGEIMSFKSSERCRKVTFPHLSTELKVGLSTKI
uniref:Uncharacterized protein n=1 Tax=Clytia hemisphaerica TaxID=252671 RepID=A0A7M5TTY4_9CNID